MVYITQKAWQTIVRLLDLNVTLKRNQLHLFNQVRKHLIQVKHLCLSAVLIRDHCQSGQTRKVWKVWHYQVPELSKVLVHRSCEMQTIHSITEVYQTEIIRKVSPKDNKNMPSTTRTHKLIFVMNICFKIIISNCKIGIIIVIISNCNFNLIR